MIHKCQFESCNGHATGNLLVLDKETLKEVDCCIDCWNTSNRPKSLLIEINKKEFTKIKKIKKRRKK